MNLQKAAARFAIPAKTITRWIIQKKLPAKRRGNEFHVRPSDISRSLAFFAYTYADLSRLGANEGLWAYYGKDSLDEVEELERAAGGRRGRSVREQVQ